MCVIMVATKVRPTDEMIDAAWKQNDDGAGIAWFVGEKSKSEVAWKKGIMDVDSIKKLIHELPLPFVVHFRVASVGGVKQTLTHPFLVNEGATLELEGRTKGAVLFHNGHWAPWQDKTLEAAIHSNNRVPNGQDWSDTRAIAFMTHIYGEGLMDILSQQRGVYMNPQKIKIYSGPGWEKINDVWCSNDIFWKRRSYSTNTSSHRPTNSGYGRVCHKGRCRNRAQDGKDICESCEKEEHTVTSSQQTTSSKLHLVEIATGGQSRGPLAKIFTSDEVEKMHNANPKIVSKNLMKNYRKFWGLRNNPGKSGARANKRLQELCERIVMLSSDGVVH